MSTVAVCMGEVAQSWRALLRRPGYLLLAVLTLALGVATTTTVFALIDQALLRPLPFADSERLVTVGMQIDGIESLRTRNLGAPGFYVAAKRMRTLSSVGMIMGFPRNRNIAVGERGEVVPSLSVDRGFLQTLGMPLLLGRNFSAEEDRPQGPQAAILSYQLWQQRFAGDPAIVGKSLQVEGTAVLIIGVLPREFVWPDPVDLLLPLQPDPASTSTATNEYVVARLAPTASLAAASAEAEALMHPLYAAAADEEESRKWLQRAHFSALPLHESVFTSRSGNRLWVFLGAALCVLAIAAFNLGNLMLLRSLARDHDSAVRAALGAPALRLALPGLAEAVLIGVCGASVGLLLAASGLHLLGQWVPSEWLRGQSPQLGVAAFAFALFCALAVALLGALLGWWRGRRQSALAALGREGRSGLGRGASRLARVLVVSQVAAASVLLLGGAMFAQTLYKLSQVPMGFRSQSLVTFSLAPLRASVGDIGAVNQQANTLLQALQREPGVGAAAATNALPTGEQFNTYVEFPDGRGSSVQYRVVSAGFHQTFAIPLLAGRALEPLTDRADSEPVALVSEAFAREFLGGDALGKLVQMPVDGKQKQALRVVGVVGDVRQTGPASPLMPVLYVALEQVPAETWMMLRDFVPLRYVLQVPPGSEGEWMRRLPELVGKLSPGQPISNLQTMQVVVASTTHKQRLNLLLVGVFSGLALLLAAVGLYAVMAVAVSARQQEFGIRAALGAAPPRLLTQVLGEGGRQLALGLAIGLALALTSSRLLQRFLFGLDTADPLAIVLVVAVLTLTGLLACLLPALRAARVPPMQVLRGQ